MKHVITAGLLMTYISCSAQSSEVRNPLNTCVEYANQSADEVTAVVKAIIEYYPAIHQKNNWAPPKFVCPVQQDTYYYSKAAGLVKSNSRMFDLLIEPLTRLKASADAIDKKCKELDTYHKLEDYKRDNFVKAESIIAELQQLIIGYRHDQKLLKQALESHYTKFSGTTPIAYAKADSQMLQQIDRERSFLDSWTFNLKQENHSGWAVDKLQQSISETAQQLDALKKISLSLRYPASSMWPHFQESMSAMLQTKRTGLDGFNFDAKKSDKHSNDVYLDLINYFNGTLVADYNTFLNFSERDGYHGLLAIKYVPAYQIRSATEPIAIQSKPFQEVSADPINPIPQKNPITKPTFESLTNYVDFINETRREIDYIQSTLTNFNSSAVYFKTLSSFEKRAPMHFDYKEYKIPLALYQKTAGDSRVLPPQIAKSLNAQAETLLNILKEIDEQSASLEAEVTERAYEKDQLEKLYTILERQQDLFLIWDERKERLYSDLQKVYDSYPVQSASNPWQISGGALRSLTDLNHDALFQAKSFYRSGSPATVATEKIDLTIREVIANEYQNMKGIEKIGRNNGLCPYTPYEDLPETSKRLSEEFKKLKPASNGSRYSHPYHNMVYLYNEVVDDYNKFCELSKEALHLKTIKQPELFSVKYPDSTPRQLKTEAHRTPATTEQPTTPVSKPSSAQPQQATVIHDTVFIEKRDTIYLPEAAENFRSMDGYASNNMVLLLDVSGSMNAPEKLPLLKSSVLNMIAMMRPEDKISIISFSGKPKVLLTSSSFKEEEKIKKAIGDLNPGGKTDGNAGLSLAYKIADENYIRGGNNRIILATDGQFAVLEKTMELIEKFSSEDIFLSVFNFGKGAGASKALENLADLGKGNYESITKENVEVKLIREAKSKRRK